MLWKEERFIFYIQLNESLLYLKKAMTFLSSLLLTPDGRFYGLLSAVMSSVILTVYCN